MTRAQVEMEVREVKRVGEGGKEAGICTALQTRVLYLLAMFPERFKHSSDLTNIDNLKQE